MKYELGEEMPFLFDQILLVWFPFSIKIESGKSQTMAAYIEVHKMAALSV